MPKITRKVDVVCDLQFGSTGKGLLAGYLTATGQYDTIICANMPNAGHTTVLPDGTSWVHKAMPNGLSPSEEGSNVPAVTRVMIAAGAVFDPARLAEELHHITNVLDFAYVDLYIHEAAGILKPEHKAAEAANLSRISSTMQGSGEAVCSKVRREPDAIVANNEELMAKHGLLDFVVKQDEWLDVLESADRILVEGSQGYSLGISAGFYPYCTSRECTAARILADCGIPPLWLDKVYGVARVHPIRVGNTVDGHSGDCYHDQEETTWEAIGQTPEKTTVTQRVRRVFTWSDDQFKEAVLANSCTNVLLNFANYDYQKALEIVERYPEIITHVGVGPRNDQVLTADEFIEFVKSGINQSLV